MPIDTKFVLGYGGWATIRLNKGNKKFVPMINCTITRNNSVSFLSSYHLPYSDEPRSKIRMNEGVYSYQGSISFQLTQNLIDLFFTSNRKFFARNSMVDLQICDGEKYFELQGCVWNSFGFDASPGQTINCNMNFMFVNSYEEQIDVLKAQKCPLTIKQKDGPIPYWQLGSGYEVEEMINSFGIHFNRDVRPIYLNNKYKMPTYLRVGMLQCDINVSCLQDWFYYTTFKIGSKKFTLNHSYRAQQSWQINGIQGEGYKTYVLKGSNLVDQEVFTIT